MSEENVEVVLRAVEALNRRDADSFVTVLAPDGEWEDPLFWSGGATVYLGREELREWFSQILEPWESFHFGVKEIAGADDRVLLGGLLTGRGKGSGVDAPGLQVWQVFWMANGETTRRRVFLDRGEALEAARLSA
jgi:ketosteroid isomerase-like protein